MKKNLLIILISVFLILLLIYFYNVKEIVFNRNYEKANIYIEYPYFQKTNIDNQLESILSKYLYSDNREIIFIDYDYYKLGDTIDLAMYIYQIKEHVMEETIKYFKVDFKNDLLIRKNGLEVSYSDDILFSIDNRQNRKLIALTFDDGPNYNTSKVLSILEKYHVKATFFLLGSNIRGNEMIIQKMKSLGMEIGNHMYSHKLMSKLTNREIEREINLVDDAVFQIIQEYPSLLRPSYGSYTDRIKILANRPIITWNVDTLDWKDHNSKKIYKRVLNSVGDGKIILMHDIYSATTNSLELIIPKLLSNGYQFVTVSELFYYKNIPLKDGKVYRNA